MIKSLGHRVGPDEITEVLYASGEIVEGVITTEPDEMRGDAIIAHVVLKEGGSLDRLKQHTARELPRYMQPVRYAIHDALELARGPVVEVHLSDIESREDWRRHSVLADLAAHRVVGKGPEGYKEALEFLARG